MKETKAAFVSIDLLDVPPEFERSESKTDDDILRRSIEASERSGQGGIQVPLAVLESADDGRYVVVRGTRRLRIARALGIPKVPVAIFELPAGETPEGYAPRLRMLLELRQDLVPTQRAALIKRLKAQFGMTNLAVSQYLGVDQDSVTNWLAVDRYIEPIREAVDNGQLTLQAAHVFDGMTDRGQKTVWKAHAAELNQPGAGRRHKEIRALYPPDTHPEFYKEPDKAARRVANAKPGAKRKGKQRPSYTSDEKKRLLTSYEFKEAELAAAKEELKTMKKQIAAATPIVGAIVRNRNLWKLVPDDMKPELERFAEAYLA